jgi:hypothetical protein
LDTTTGATLGNNKLRAGEVADNLHQMIFGDIVSFRYLVDGYPAIVVLSKINQNTKRVVSESGKSHFGKFHIKI